MTKTAGSRVVQCSTRGKTCLRDDYADPIAGSGWSVLETRMEGAACPTKGLCCPVLLGRCFEEPPEPAARRFSNSDVVMRCGARVGLRDALPRQFRARGAKH